VKATEELEKIGYYAKDELLKARGSDDPEVVYRANLVFKKLRKIDDKAVEKLLPSITRLGKLGDASKEAVPELNWLLAKDNDKLRTAVIKALGNIGPAAKGAVPQLLGTLKTEADIDMSIEILSTLGHIKAKEAVKDIEECLDSTDSKIREKAAEALGNIGPDAASSSERLGNIVAYSDDDPAVRLAAAQAIGKIGPKAESNAYILATALKSDSDPDIKAACAVSIGQLGPMAVANVLPDLIEALKDKDMAPSARIATAATIASIGADAKEAKQALKDVADDKDTDKALKEACKRATAAIEAKEMKR
jgi:HEAT repeat protein